MKQNFRWVALLLPLAGLMLPNLAQAVPSFARQTGLACMQCHTVFPQLTPLGREFKLTGYNEAGAFIQATYESPDDHFTLDNVDMRFAASRQSNSGSSLTYGVTLNNNPSVQHLWNSTPAWSYPYASSGVAPAPAAGVLLDGGLGQQVGGLGFYGMWDNRLYGELTLYRAAKIGQEQPPGAGSTDTLADTSPYWRIAYVHNWGEHNLGVGTYGMFADITPAGVTGPANRYHDVALDAQYQYLAGMRTFTLHTTFMHEKQTLDASYPAATSNSSNILKTFRLDATYYMHRSYGGTLGYFSTTGDTDPLMYTPSAISRTGSSETTGWIAEFDYLPWENTRFALQYLRYNKFNGESSNYDGAGHRASDNNTLYLNGWLNF